MRSPARGRAGRSPPRRRIISGILAAAVQMRRMWGRVHAERFNFEDGFETAA